MAGLVSNVLAAVGFVCLTVGAALFAPAAGFVVAGVSCLFVSRQVAA